MYAVEFVDEIDDDLDALGLDDETEDAVLSAIVDRLSRSPRTYGQPLRRRLKGYYRIRFHRWRAIYEIRDARRVVVVCYIDDRRDVYEMDRATLDYRLARHNMPDA